MTVVYFHGFASVGNNPKTQALAAALNAADPAHTLIAPDLPVTPDQVEQLVMSLLADHVNYPLIFVGTSLGGFWANYFSSKYDAPCVLVNPAMRPSRSMYSYVGQTNLTNYATGAPITVTPDDIDQFARREKTASELRNGALIHVFAAKDDDVVPYTEVLDNLPYTASTTLTEDGGHRFELHWTQVIEQVVALANN
jgi:predicted esterase YcpF (UPF0227 family)